RGGVDLLTLEAAVLDAAGLPIHGLQPSDFTVSIDGRPRKVLFARDAGSSASTRSDAGSATERLPLGQFVANASRPPGRIVVFIIDRDSIKTGNEKALLETASTVLDSLSPDDAVGVVGLPVGGVDLTREHERVREALKMMTGTRPVQPLLYDRYLSWDEALAYEVNNDRVITEVVERECPKVGGSGDGPP